MVFGAGFRSARKRGRNFLNRDIAKSDLAELHE